MINSTQDAQERVRLILDRADSPWLTNTELNGFIELAINEYLRERVNTFGANQKLRDDFSKFVKSAVFTSEVVGENTEDDLQTYRRQFANYTAQGAFDTDTLMATTYPGGEWGSTSEKGTGCYVGEINFGTLLEVKVTSGNSLSECKVMSIDDALRASKDPFNQPGTANTYHAVRVGDYYWILPGVTNTKTIIFTFISNLNDATVITWLPVHAREEVCQIAARKVLGTTADERLPVADNEIKQLEGK